MRQVSENSSSNLDSFNQLVLQFQNLVYQQAYYLLGDPQAAEDATQDSFISAWQHYSDQRGGSLKAWLLRIVTNKCYDEMRRWKRQPQTEFEPLNIYGEEVESAYWMEERGELPEKQVENAELGQKLGEFLARLPVERRAAVLLVDIQELNYSEAAQVLGISIGTLKSRLARARKQLRSLILIEGGIEISAFIPLGQEQPPLPG